MVQQTETQPEATVTADTETSNDDSDSSNQDQPPCEDSMLSESHNDVDVEADEAA